jgi:hypothetical protein
MFRINYGPRERHNVLQWTIPGCKDTVLQITMVTEKYSLEAETKAKEVGNESDIWWLFKTNALTAPRVRYLMVIQNQCINSRDYVAYNENIRCSCVVNYNAGEKTVIIYLKAFPERTETLS